MESKLEQWVKIDAKLHNKLKELEALDKERETLIAKAEQQDKLTPTMKRELEMSLTKYTLLATEVSALKKQAKAIRTKKN